MPTIKMYKKIKTINLSIFLILNSNISAPKKNKQPKRSSKIFKFIIRFPAIKLIGKIAIKELNNLFFKLVFAKLGNIIIS